MALLAKLEALGIHPIFVSYTCLIDTLGSAGRTLEADRLFQEMIFLEFKTRIKLNNVLLIRYLIEGFLRMRVRILRVFGGIKKRMRFFVLMTFFCVFVLALCGFIFDFEYSSL